MLKECSRRGTSVRCWMANTTVGNDTTGAEHGREIDSKQNERKDLRH